MCPERRAREQFIERQGPFAGAPRNMELSSAERSVDMTSAAGSSVPFWLP